VLLELGLDGCEVRLCGLCAFVRPRVPCVPCVSRLPPVSFYRYCTGFTVPSRTRNATSRENRRLRSLSQQALGVPNWRQ
jgi:hypothetical protein